MLTDAPQVFSCPVDITLLLSEQALSSIPPLGMETLDNEFHPNIYRESERHDPRPPGDQFGPRDIGR